ncbi:MAG TPA: 2-oxo acid dehydrogenase subunit E2 [Myxococcota bacterium]|nr:2-oxo acid dehydrogenase subunit E2 [Myxococcota bacterium]HRY94279.1 2-oxo acid dehydrogenase subunit E2 [Myxococcota bacterium]HSA21400.1 2-oxo acid dehydrogenase subunit E2 [Myxococcota bacterium]
MGIRNVQVKALRKTPPFRKVAMGTWAHPGDPQIYGTLEIDLTKAYAWRDRLPPEAPRVTVTQMVGRAIGLAMARYPDLNGFVRFRKIYLRQSVDLAFLVAVQHPSGREDLSSIKVARVDEKGVTELAAEMAAKVERLRTRQDTELQKSSKLVSLMPGFLVRFFLWLTAFIGYTLNLRCPGIPRDPFGACILTNVGMFGLDVAYAPLVPYSRAPIVLLVGQAKPRPVVVDGRIEVREVVTLNATIDHRFCDGALLAKMVKVIKESFEDPDAHFGPALPPPREAAPRAA